MPVLANAANTVDVFEHKYEKDGHVSFILKQGEVSEQVVDLMGKMYPNHNVVFRQQIGGYLPADLELSGNNREVISVEMLAGLGLSACVYKNSIIEIGKFKKRGICSTAKLPNGKYPDVKKVARGTLSFTDEWYGSFDPIVTQNPTQAIAASYSPEAPIVIKSPDNVPADAELNPLLETSEPADSVPLPIEIQPTPETVSFEFKHGAIMPQVRELVLKFDGAPPLVWELDENLQWFNNGTIEGKSYEEIFAKVLLSYDAFADVFLNAVIVREAEGI